MEQQNVLFIIGFIAIGILIYMVWNIIRKQINTLDQGFNQQIHDKSESIKSEVKENRTTAIHGFDSTKEFIDSKMYQNDVKQSEFLTRINDGINALKKETVEIIDRFKGQTTEQSNGTQQLLETRLNGFGTQQRASLKGMQEELKSFGNNNQTILNSLQSKLINQLHDVRKEVAAHLDAIQKDNSKQLDKMRNTVDEKLEKTLDLRLKKSFDSVGQQLEAVHKGLGEMQTIANGVGDLKKVLSNVKTRGVLGEMQLGNILEEVLAPSQYGVNVKTIPGSSSHVEFAIKFPGLSKIDQPVWLPVDSKFPMDRYEMLVDAYEKSNKELVNKRTKELLNTVKTMAADIRNKYISPPYTTDFGILFLPVEGLYAELARQPGLMHDLQRNYKVIIAGPSNLSALLNSLQLGFKTLAIQERSSEVWDVLGKVKTEFSNFGGVLQKVQKNLKTATNSIDTIGTRTRAMERQLKGVESLPVAKQLLELGEDLEINENLFD